MMVETPPPASQGETSGKVSPQKDQQFIPVPEALAMATQAMQEGKLKEAEGLCQQIIQARPRVPETYNLLGVVLHRQGQTKDAIKAIKGTQGNALLGVGGAGGVAAVGYGAVRLFGKKD